MKLYIQFPKAQLRNLFLAIFLSISVSEGCISATVDSNANSKERVLSSISDCSKLGYLHKDTRELDRLLVNELLDELITEHMCHQNASWSDRDHDNEYEQGLSRRILASRLTILPALISAVEAYDTKNITLRTDASLAVATDISVALDRDISRVRATSNGRTFIGSLDRKAMEMENAGFARPSDGHYARFSLIRIYLQALNGINETDRAIADTFWVKKRVKLSEEELLSFGEFLTNRFPDYPSWSTTSFIKDNSRINEAGNPLQVYVLTNPERFFVEYEIFKKRRARKQ